MSDNQTDVGFKIAKPFFDVNTAADSDLILNSSWPTLQIAFEKTVTGSSSTEHGLGFPAFTVLWTITNGVAIKSIPNVDDVHVYHGTGTVHIKCYNINLSKDIDYPVIKDASIKAPVDNDFGIKLVKEGKNLSSNDMRDFVLHSRCQSPLVLAVKTEKSATVNTTGGTITYSNPYLNPVWVFGYVKAGNLYKSAPYFSQAYPRTFINSNNTYQISWSSSANDNGATLLMLRDPIFSGTYKQVQY